MPFPDTAIQDSIEDFDELSYLELNPDVADAVRQGGFSSGYVHWTQHGRWEGRHCRRTSDALIAGLRRSMVACREQVSLSGRIPESPATLWGRFTGFAVRILGRALKWYFDQQLRQGDAVTKVLQEEISVLESLAASIAALEARQRSDLQTIEDSLLKLRSGSTAQAREAAILGSRLDDCTTEIASLDRAIQQFTATAKDTSEQQQQQINLVHHSLDLFRSYVHSGYLPAAGAKAGSDPVAIKNGSH
jgi:hypothetical protein